MEKGGVGGFGDERIWSCWNEKCFGERGMVAQLQIHLTYLTYIYTCRSHLRGFLSVTISDV